MSVSSKPKINQIASQHIPITYTYISLITTTSYHNNPEQRLKHQMINKSYFRSDGNFHLHLHFVWPEETIVCSLFRRFNVDCLCHRCTVIHLGAWTSDMPRNSLNNRFPCGCCIRQSTLHPMRTKIHIVAVLVLPFRKTVFLQLSWRGVEAIYFNRDVNTHHVVEWRHCYIRSAVSS